MWIWNWKFLAVSVENKPVKEAIVSDLFTKAEEVIISAPEKESIPSVSVKSEESNVKITPVAREMMEEYNLSIVNMIGKTVYSTVTSDREFSVETAQLPVGLYMVNVQNKAHNYVMKLMVTK